jgi:hypothetical protein
MKLLKLVKSRKKDKKWDALFESDGKQKVVSFGSANMTDYTLGASEEQRAAYRKRHKRDLDTGDPTRAGFLSYYILWGPSRDMDENERAYRKRFNL